MVGNHLRALGEIFNIEMEERPIKSHKTSNWAFINRSNSTCIDLILTDTPRKFQSTCILEAVLSDFHLITEKLMRKIFQKRKPEL